MGVVGEKGTSSGSETNQLENSADKISQKRKFDLFLLSSGMFVNE
jgi:hypothetical protein